MFIFRTSDNTYKKMEEENVFIFKTPQSALDFYRPK